MNNHNVKKQVQYALFVATVLIIISGIGITEPQIITPLTLGFMGKLMAYRIHTLLWGPFTVLFIIHVALNLPGRWFFEKS